MNTINHWTRRRSKHCCAYCDQPASATIPVAGSDHVCPTHAREFWQGLMAYAKDRANERHLKTDLNSNPLTEAQVLLQEDRATRRLFPLQAARMATAA